MTQSFVSCPNYVSHVPILCLMTQSFGSCLNPLSRVPILCLMTQSFVSCLNPLSFFQYFVDQEVALVLISPTVGSNHNQTRKTYHFLHGLLSQAAITSTMPVQQRLLQQCRNKLSPHQVITTTMTKLPLPQQAATVATSQNKLQQQQRQDQTRRNNAANAAATIRCHNNGHHRHNIAAATMTNV
jgi:hypothetical protein